MFSKYILSYFWGCSTSEKKFNFFLNFSYLAHLPSQKIKEDEVKNKAKKLFQVADRVFSLFANKFWPSLELFAILASPQNSVLVTLLTMFVCNVFLITEQK